MPMMKNKMTSISLQNLEFMVECRHCIYGHSDLLIYPSNRLSGVAETLVIYFYKSHATIFPTDIDLCVYKTDIYYVQLPNQAHSSNIYCPAHHTSPPTQDFHPQYDINMSYYIVEPSASQVENHAEDVLGVKVSIITLKI